MKKAARALTALLVSAVMLLSGCTTNNPQLAARVGGVAITEAQVDVIARSLAGAMGAEYGAMRFTAVSELIGNELTRQIGTTTGTTVSEAERLAMLAGNPNLSQMAAEPALTDFIHAFVDARVIQNKLGPDAFNTAAQAVSVEVNPRFGTWNPNLARLNGDSGSLSRPAPTPSATASA